MAASQVFSGLGEPTGLELDPAGSLWVNNSGNNSILKLVNGQLVSTVNGIDGRLWGGFGIDRDNNIMLTGWDPQEVLIYSPTAYSSTSTFLQANQYGSFNQIGSRGMTDPDGLEVTNDQLIVSDQSRLLFWNNPTQLTNNYPAASGVVGQPDFMTQPRWVPVYGRSRADTHGRLWVVKAASGGSAQILAYNLPLVTGANPVITIPSPIPLLGGGTFSWTWSLLHTGLAYQPNCDCMWFSDRNNHRDSLQSRPGFR